MPQIQRVWRANMQVYGADKAWRQLAHEGVTVAPLYGKAADVLHGATRGDAWQARASDSKTHCPLDRLNRQFVADGPDQLWVSAFTYVSTWHRVDCM